MARGYRVRGNGRTALAVAKIAEITAGLPRASAMQPAEARRLLDARWVAYARSLSSGRVAARDRMLPLRTGAMRVRVYSASPRCPSALLIFIHGGGWVMRSPETSDFVCEQLALDLECVVASLDYPLAPENPCPAAVEACVEAVRHIAGPGAGDWPAAPLCICGESAGANIALATMLCLRGEAAAPLAGLLFYGAYDDDHSTLSHRLYGGGDFGLSSADMAWFWRHYLAGGDPRAQPLARPLRCALAGLPPIFLAAAEFDCLRDDTERLAARLAEAGVTHETHLVREAVHGCLNIAPVCPQLALTRRTAARFLRSHLARGIDRRPPAQESGTVP